MRKGRGSGSKENVGRKPHNKKKVRFVMEVEEGLFLTWRTIYGRGLPKKIRQLLDEDMQGKTIIL